jgi:arylsulfatase
METRAKKPNFLLIVVDDMGYSDCEPFGGEIRTPHLMKLANNGVRFRRFYTSSLCAPTRSLLLTGVDNHLNGLGVMPPFHSMNQFMKPGYEGTLNANVATIAELLGDDGYFTCMAGKWHLGKKKRRAAGASRIPTRIQLSRRRSVALFRCEGARSVGKAAYHL